MIAKVIVDVNIKKLNRPFDYYVPAAFERLIKPGTRVVVPFNVRKVMGIVLSVEEGEQGELKSIDSFLDVSPTFNHELLELGQNIANETASNLIHTFKTMIPSAMKAKYRKYIEVDEKKLYFDHLDSESLKNFQELVKQGNEVVYEVTEKGKKKTEKWLRLINSDNVKSEKQLAVIEFLQEDKKKKDCTEHCSESSIRTLIKNGNIEEYEVEVYRDIETTIEYKEVELLPEQLNAVESVQNGVNLLHGVTGSGKTEVYMELIDRTDKEVILLVPEISLTYQMISRFKGRFKDQVAILHSGLSEGEKYDEWRKILRKEVRIVIGARSAIFAPFDNIGLIILDEEHESTYKQEDSPRYHAREVAKLRANYHNCPLVLGSATPSLESYARAKRGVYNLIEMKERYSQSLPKVHIVNMQHEDNNISSRLLEMILKRVKNKEQIILLVNRRGYSNFVLCKDCGETIKCDSCDVSLTHHKYKNRLECHYCGFSTHIPTTCPSCGSDRIDFLGIGTESVEEELNNALPGIRILRMDQDTTRKKNATRDILDKFRNHEADVLLGTQMIAKGLDFPNVTLVGVISCDQILNLPDFRSSERTYQLLTQVAGRSGRAIPGEVVLQTFNTDHYAIKSVEKQFSEFYDQEMEYRRIAGYVPYFFVENLILTSKDFKSLNQEAVRVKEFVEKALSKQARILGPVVPSISRIKNYYRMQIIIKYKQEPKLLDVYEQLDKYMDDSVDVRIDRYPTYMG